jgi:hypothetical protein
MEKVMTVKWKPINLETSGHKFSDETVLLCFYCILPNGMLKWTRRIFITKSVLVRCSWSVSSPLSGCFLRSIQKQSYLSQSPHPSSGEGLFEQNIETCIHNKFLISLHDVGYVLDSTFVCSTCSYLMLPSFRFVAWYIPQKFKAGDYAVCCKFL